MDTGFIVILSTVLGIWYPFVFYLLWRMRVMQAKIDSRIDKIDSEIAESRARRAEAEVTRAGMCAQNDDGG